MYYGSAGREHAAWQRYPGICFVRLFNGATAGTQYGRPARCCRTWHGMAWHGRAREYNSGAWHHGQNDVVVYNEAEA